VHIYILVPKLPQWNFLQISQLSNIYTKWCAQTYSPIYRLFEIFDRNFSKIVASTNDENENYVVHLKELSIV